MSHGPAAPSAPGRILVATRSAGKRREIARILGEVEGIRLVTLDEIGLEPSPEEEAVEAFETFAENAAAKASYFRARTGLPTLADDSGLVVDALDGRPGVRSRRFAPGEELRGNAQDEANNRHLVALLERVPDGLRTARYVCVAALDLGDGSPPLLFEGRVEGTIARTPRGSGGFGYDPYFEDPGSGRTFAELSPADKDARSHRGRAFRKVAGYLASKRPPAGGSAAPGRPR